MTYYFLSIVGIIILWSLYIFLWRGRTTRIGIYFLGIWIALLWPIGIPVIALTFGIRKLGDCWDDDICSRRRKKKVVAAVMAERMNPTRNTPNQSR
jgi:hypothetical protein